MRLPQIALIVAAAASLLCCRDSSDYARGRAEAEAQRFTPLAQRVFAAAAMTDSIAVKALVLDSVSLHRTLVIGANDRTLFADAARGVRILNSPLLVTSDSAWVTYLPQGHHSPRDVLGLQFVRVGKEWRVVYVTFLQRD